MKNTSVIKTVIEFRLAEANGTSVSRLVLLREFSRVRANSFCSSEQTKAHDLAASLKSILLGDKSGQGVVMSNNARKLYDRVLENTSRPLDEICDTLLFSMINFVSSVTGELIILFSSFEYLTNLFFFRCRF
jgi:hypothetical protein